ncbi:MAG TPA: DUF4381 domain-containing protein [Telluria sp.]|nr:DUF4381 domain-containing protein [Telluria sp.]
MNPASLDALRDIRLPPADPLWLAPQWWIAALLLACVAVGTAAWWLRHLVRTRVQRRALRELAALATTHAHDGDGTQLARGLSRLLRRYALARFPEARVAALTGHAWLAFLDAHGGNGAFCNGVGAALATRPYQPCGELDATALVALVRAWLKANPQ